MGNPFQGRHGHLPNKPTCGEFRKIMTDEENLVSKIRSGSWRARQHTTRVAVRGRKACDTNRISVLAARILAVLQESRQVHRVAHKHADHGFNGIRRLIEIDEFFDPIASPSQ